VGVHVSQAAECLDYNAVSLRKHARLSIGRLDIKNTFAILCAEHPNSQVMPAGRFFDFLGREADPKGKPAYLAKSERD
jgi:hypothetical protein